MLLERQNRLAEAQKAYEKVLEIDPNAAIAANNLAWRYAESGGNLDLAQQLAQTAKSQGPDNPLFSDTLGWVYYKQGLPDAAVPLIRAAIDSDPGNPQYHYHLGLTYAKQGEDSKAIATLKGALALSPTFDGADEARRVIGELSIP
jgi:tetratricopeptide (TPR) repeat protein